MRSAANLAPGTRVLVTGAAGFIGSHLCERLLADGHEVVGVDCFTEFYPRATKERNLTGAREWRSFSLLEADLTHASLAPALEGVDVVMHLAAQPGVRASIRRGGVYRERNVVATRRLLEQAGRAGACRVVHASSSSVYGGAGAAPTTEEAPLRPLSLYAQSKAAAERVVSASQRRYGVPAVALRFFSVYGPRQRPDMAFHRFIRACLAGEPVPLIGDGRQVRDFTYVGDAVEAMLAAAAHGSPGAAYNIGSGEPVELREALALIAALTARRPRVERLPPQPGEARRTACDGTRARRELGFVPRTPLHEGIAAQLRDLASRRVSLRAAA